MSSTALSNTSMPWRRQASAIAGVRSTAETRANAPLDAGQRREGAEAGAEFHQVARRHAVVRQASAIGVQQRAADLVAPARFGRREDELAPELVVLGMAVVVVHHRRRRARRHVQRAAVDAAHELAAVLVEGLGGLGLAAGRAGHVHELAQPLVQPGQVARIGVVLQLAELGGGSRPR
jgi:hypothetical protein